RARDRRAPQSATGAASSSASAGSGTGVPTYVKPSPGETTPGLYPDGAKIAIRPLWISAVRSETWSPPPAGFCHRSAQPPVESGYSSSSVLVLSIERPPFTVSPDRLGPPD